VVLKISSKFIEWINSETTDDAGASQLKRGTSIITWLFIFFSVVPYLLAFARYLFGITFQSGSTISGIINFSLYYILNAVIATLGVKWQNKQLAKKSLKFRKIYMSIIFLITMVFGLVSLIAVLGRFFTFFIPKS
jgi:hypothetical protein